MRFLKIVFTRFKNEGCSTRAAALAYTTLLSLVPLLATSFAIFSFFPAFEAASSKVQTFILTHVVVSSGAVIQHYIQQFVGQTVNLSIIGFITLVITAILMLYNIELAFNAIWGVKKRRKIIPRILLYISVLFLAPILLVISSGILSALSPFVFSVIIFTLFYYVIPNYAVPLRSAFIAAIIISVLVEFSKRLFSLYLHYFASYDLFYGALSVIPIFLLWIYIIWLIVLLGVIISHELTIWHGSKN